MVLGNFEGETEFVKVVKVEVNGTDIYVNYVDSSDILQTRKLFYNGTISGGVPILTNVTLE